MPELPLDPESVKRLAYYARRVVGNRCIDGMTYEDFVAQALIKYLSGKRMAKDPRAVTLTELMGTVRSLVFNARRKERRHRAHAGQVLKALPTVEWPAETPVETPPISLDAEARSLCAGDPELTAFYDVYASGVMKPRKVAARLGWEVTKVNVVKRKLLRRLQRHLDSRASQPQTTPQTTRPKPR